MGEMDIEKKDLINNLNNDCLISIFEHLSLYDRIKIERVCKRWKSVAKKSWTNYKTLDFKLLQSKETDITNKLRSVLFRCGRFLNKIIIIGGNNVIYKMVTVLCPNIKNLIIIYSDFNDDTAEILAEKYHDLVELHCECIKQNFNLRTIFENNRKLKRLSLLHLSNFDKYSLIYLPNTIESLNVNDCRSISPIQLNNALSRLKDLETLCIKAGPFMNRLYENSNLEALGNCTKLKTLIFEDTNCIAANCGSIIVKLPDLIKLNVSFNSYVTNDFITKIIRSCCNITSLSISGCLELTSEYVSKVFSLPNLKILEMDCMHLEEFTVDMNFAPLKLTEVSLQRSLFNDKSICSLLKCSPRLRKLKLNYCCSFTRKVIKCAIKCTNDRTNDILLEIETDLTKFHTDTVVRVSPLLHIVNSGLKPYGLTLKNS